MPVSVPPERQPVRGFETLGDPELERMEKAAAEWVEALAKREHPRWCSLLGPSGIGKTHLAKWAKKTIAKTGLNIGHDKRLNISKWLSMRFIYWPDLIAEIRESNYQKSNEIKAAIEPDIVFIDDIGAEYLTEPVVAMASRIFNNRLGKWTFITSNLSLKDFAEKMNAQISDRMIREGNRVTMANTQSYSLRNWVA